MIPKAVKKKDRKLYLNNPKKFAPKVQIAKRMFGEGSHENVKI
jgi:hypothetical protein